MPIGKTNDAGWQIGVSKTLPHRAEIIWSFLTSDDGINIWLGAGIDPGLTKGESYETTDGTTGEIRSYHPHNRIRLTWQPVNWDHETTIQVAIQAKGDRTLVRFHQERLANATEREQQRSHWKQVMDDLLSN